MYYRIAARINLSGKGVVRAWYSGRKTGKPRFEENMMHEAVLRYYYVENAQDDKAFLERQSELCEDVEIVAFTEHGQVVNGLNEDPNSATIELEHVSALEILDDVQEILSQVVAAGQRTEINRKEAHEQTRVALGLVLKAISALKNSG